MLHSFIELPRWGNALLDVVLLINMREYAIWPKQDGTHLVHKRALKKYKEATEKTQVHVSVNVWSGECLSAAHDSLWRWAQNKYQGEDRAGVPSVPPPLKTMHSDKKHAGELRGGPRLYD